MKIGDIIYLTHTVEKWTGLLPADGSYFTVKDFPDLSEMYEFQHGMPDGLKRMWTPDLSREKRTGRIPHVVAKLPLQVDVQPRQEASPRKMTCYRP